MHVWVFVFLTAYSTARIYINPKMHIKHAKNRVQVQIKKCACQKIVYACISLIHLPHQCVGGRPFVFLLLAVCCFKK